MNSDEPSAPSYTDIISSTQQTQINQSISIQELSKFDLLVKRNELNSTVANLLYDILSTCEVVLLCDDSDSMISPIAEEGTDPFAPTSSTRWRELKKLASIIIQFITAIKETGLDIYFLNRDKICGVNTIVGLQDTFNKPPTGGTNLVKSLMEIYNDKKDILSYKKLLIVVITDGEPVDGTNNARDNLRSTIEYMVSNSNNNLHLSFTECTDNAEDMSYLDQWNGNIFNFDNTDDYREELQRVKLTQGTKFKFDYTDYVVKILLCTFVRYYFNLDMVKVNSLPQYFSVNQISAAYNRGVNNSSSQTDQLYQPSIKPPIQLYQHSVQTYQSSAQPSIQSYQSSVQPYQPPIQPPIQTYRSPVQQSSNKRLDDSCCNIL